MEAAVKQIVNFLAYGMDADTGLPYHGYSVADDCKYGITSYSASIVSPARRSSSHRIRLPFWNQRSQ